MWPSCLRLEGITGTAELTPVLESWMRLFIAVAMRPFVEVSVDSDMVNAIRSSAAMCNRGNGVSSRTSSLSVEV